MPDLNSHFNGRHVVVTGGAGALGGAVVQALVDAGANVHVPWIDQAEVDRFPLAKRVNLVRADLASEREVESFFAAIPSIWASIHVAGGFAMKPVAELSRAEFDGLMATNATTCFLCCREAVKSMRRTGGGGRIVNVAARPALYPTAGMLAYSVSKSAVAALTRHLAEEVRADRILVNAVAPGVMDTPANRAAMPDADRSGWSRVEDVAEAIAFLASPRNQLVTGDILPLF
jgi:NAD(P)-dependent dehydrogenase (short-subunit alcohol dehydrogenase family)